MRRSPFLLQAFICLLALNVAWVCACAASQWRPRMPRSYHRLYQPALTVPQLSMCLEETEFGGLDSALAAPSLTLHPPTQVQVCLFPEPGFCPPSPARADARSRAPPATA